MLPVAPATDCMASTSGTPAANMVESVRAKRAIADLLRMGPMIGNFSMYAIEPLERIFLRALVEIEKRIECAAPMTIATHQPLVLHESRQVDDHLREGGQIRAEALEQLLELRNHENQQDDRDDDATTSTAIG
jgi:hypothetical protein